MDADDVKGAAEFNGKITLSYPAMGLALSIIVALGGAVSFAHVQFVKPALAAEIVDRLDPKMEGRVDAHRREVDQAMAAHEREFERTLISIRNELREIRVSVERGAP